jgi:hypothetical protein
MFPQTLLEAHRRDLRAITALADNDLQLLWRRFDVSDGVRAREALMQALPELVGAYGSAAATLGADWYDDLRDTAAPRARRFRAAPAGLPDADRTDALARWGVEPLFKATGPEMAAAATTALSNVGGGLQRILANAARATVITSTGNDPAAQGWSRSTSGGCDFCKMLAGRGAVYRTVDTADFEAHDRCHCIAVPAF